MSDRMLPVPGRTRSATVNSPAGVPALTQTGVLALGAVAAGALAIGAVAIGRLAIGRLAMAELPMSRQRPRRGEATYLVIAKVWVGQLGRADPEPPPMAPVRLPVDAASANWVAGRLRRLVRSR
ncbi:MAG: hypothetical protein M3Y41_12930 [Pseudomonadota bacterium]|nr:hypothetical protein [Pseudomonadota bacterium]